MKQIFHHVFICAIIFVASMTAACSDRPDAPDSALNEASVIYHHGSIWSGVDGAAWSEAIVIADGRIIEIGTNEEAEELRAAHTQMIDLEGAFVVPGFIDNHTHFLTGGFGLASVDLRDADSPADFSRRIGDFAAAQPSGRWIRFGDWDHESWGGALPQKDWIDALTPDNPVFVMRLDGHMALANSKAITLAGVTAHTPDPEGGEIVRDENGEPTGIFKDTAMAFIAAVIPPPTDEEFDQALAAAIDHAVSRGVTQIHDMSDGEWDSFAAFRRAHERNALGLRVYSFLPLSDWELVNAFVGQEGRSDDWLRWGGLKGFVDGSLGSTTAWFYEPYDDAPETSGFVLQDLDQLQSWLTGADAAGLNIAIHAIGDRANGSLLKAFATTVAENGPRSEGLPDRRFRIEHAQHLNRDAIVSFADARIIASMQPYHAIDDGRWAQKRIGPDRIKTTYAFRSLLDAGVVLTFGSDWTVAPIDPIAGIFAAVTRQTTDGANPDGWVPEQKITVAEALRAYTVANAYAGYQEDILGTLENGKYADFVVLSEDLFVIDPEDIQQVRVLRTIIAGEEKYKAVN